MERQVLVGGYESSVEAFCRSYRRILLRIRPLRIYRGERQVGPVVRIVVERKSCVYEGSVTGTVDARLNEDVLLTDCKHVVHLQENVKVPKCNLVPPCIVSVVLKYGKIILYVVVVGGKSKVVSHGNETVEKRNVAVHARKKAEQYLSEIGRFGILPVHRPHFG